MSHNNPFIRRIARCLASDPHDEAFLYDLLITPDDLTTRAVYFDWLAERGDPRGEYAHLLRELHQTHINPAARKSIQVQLDQSRPRIDPLWLGFLFREPIPGIVTRIDDHGFWVDLGGIEGQAHICDCSWC